VAAETLSTLLLAGFGVNRPRSGGRTAPSAHGWQEIGVYVALPEGLYRFDAPAHALELTVEQDVRALTGVQTLSVLRPSTWSMSPTSRACRKRAKPTGYSSPPAMLR
jgi:hypothetical protein